MLAACAARYVGAAAETSQEAAVTEPGIVTVREAGTGRLAQEIRIGRHRLLADEPESVGGTDAGPTPYGYLLAGLGACTAMTLRLYADRKQWPLAGVSVRLAHDKVHAAACAQCETPAGRTHHIHRDTACQGPPNPPP